MMPGVPVLTFVSCRGAFVCECQNQRDTSNHWMRVPLFHLKFLVRICRSLVQELQMGGTRWIFPIVTMLVLGASVSAQAETIQIAMENLEIAPVEAKARVGDTVEWINKDVFAHTATARNGEWDVMLPPKKNGTLVLKKAGTVEYYCRFHPNMKATLTVAP